MPFTRTFPSRSEISKAGFPPPERLPKRKNLASRPRTRRARARTAPFPWTSPASGVAHPHQEKREARSKVEKKGAFMHASFFLDLREKGGEKDNPTRTPARKENHP